MSVVVVCALCTQRRAYYSIKNRVTAAVFVAVVAGLSVTSPTGYMVDVMVVALGPLEDVVAVQGVVSGVDASFRRRERERESDGGQLHEALSNVCGRRPRGAV